MDDQEHISPCRLPVQFGKPVPPMQGPTDANGSPAEPAPVIQEKP